MGKDICIISGEEVSKGYKVIDDPVIKLIRKVKKSLGILKNNRLYVSEASYDEYLKRRKQFEKMVFIASLAVSAIIVLTIFLPLLRGDIERAVSSVVAALAFAVLFTFVIIARYVPRVETNITEVKKSKKLLETKVKQPAKRPRPKKTAKSRKSASNANKPKKTKRRKVD